jgi:hypothetical protein
MFYTLVSRSLITKINTPRDYFYIFLIGSVGYVILHWYLHMDKREGIIEKVREYLYYAMVLDVITAYVLMKMYPAKSDKKNTEDTGETKDSNEDQYTPEQKKAIMQKMQEARRLQQMRQKQLADQNGSDPQNLTKEQQSDIPKQDGDEMKEAGDSGKRSIFTKSEESKESNESESETQAQDGEKDKTENIKTISRTQPDIKVKGKKKDSEIQDTEIQVYEGQEKVKAKKAEK